MSEYAEKLCDLKRDLIDHVTEYTSNGYDDICASELHEAIDMIKDLAIAEKECAEAAYFHAVTDAMDSAGGAPEAHISSMIESVKAIWSDADYARKQQIKAQLSNLLTEMV